MPARVFGGPTTIRPPTSAAARRTYRWRAASSTSLTRRPTSSDQRRPGVGQKRHNVALVAAGGRERLNFLGGENTDPLPAPEQPTVNVCRPTMSRRARGFPHAHGTYRRRP